MKHASGFLEIVNKIRPQIHEVTVQEVFEMQKHDEAFALVDVREESELPNGLLPHAIHLSKGVLERDIEKTIPNFNQKIVLYCGGGFRSALAAYNLQQMGYTNVHSMIGGFRGWCEAKFPVVD